MCLVGDTMFDLEGAKQIGIDCIAVRYGFGDADEMKQNGAIAVCDALPDLPGLIKALGEPVQRKE
jgi:phosphoglycolate phosphatase